MCRKPYLKQPSMRYVISFRRRLGMKLILSSLPVISMIWRIVPCVRSLRSKENGNSCTPIVCSCSDSRKPLFVRQQGEFAMAGKCIHIRFRGRSVCSCISQRWTACCLYLRNVLRFWAVTDHIAAAYQAEFSGRTLSYCAAARQCRRGGGSRSICTLFTCGINRSRI